MSERSENDTDPEKAISLAEAYLERHRQELSSDRGQVFERRIERWEQRKAELDEDDPLYEVARERIRENQERLRQLQTGSEELERRLLRVVADGFLAEGAWLDASLLRALNLILFDKYSDSLVVERHVLDGTSEFDDDDLYAVSRAVRELAREALD